MKKLRYLDILHEASLVDIYKFHINHAPGVNFDVINVKGGNKKEQLFVSLSF
jgi:hypothetical protein